MLKNSRLVKTTNFKNPVYIGDPINAVKIYNEKEVDELIFLDISASVEKRKPPLETIYEIATECFMPFTYGGGIKDLEDAKKIFNLGVEKITINTSAVENPSLITKISRVFGSQSVIVSIDVKKTWKGYKVFTYSGTKNTGLDPVEWALKAQQMGAGEILLTSIDKEGSMEGYDLDLISKISEKISMPLIAHGGAGELKHIAEGKKAGASALAAGSLFVYQGRIRSVLINYPTKSELIELLE